MGKKKLQVFISSTFVDLIEERQSAVQAVLDAGHIPAGMELFKAGNETQLDTIYKWIDNSDVYMLILGGRYGTVEENSQKSYTQLEYEYAVSKGVPVFSVVLTNDLLKTKSKILGEEKTYEQLNMDKYNEFKNVVLSKIVRMVDDSKDIMLSIHTTLNDFLNDYEMVGWVREDDLEANVTLLKQINDLTLENKKVNELCSSLNNRLENMLLTFESNLAFEGEVITIKGTYNKDMGRNSSGYRLSKDVEIEKDITWDKMFLLWGPYLTATISSTTAKNKLESALRDYMGKYFYINSNLFQVIKIQYSALGLIKYYESRTTKGGISEFISLTSKGGQYLNQNIAIRSGI